MYRVGIVKQNGDVISKNFEDRDSADTWILEQAEQGAKKAIIIKDKDVKTKEIINF